MAADLQKFLFKSKFMRKYPNYCMLVIYFYAIVYIVLSNASDCKECKHGSCSETNDVCQCDSGWTGNHCEYCSRNNCQHCFGKIRLDSPSGIISDGVGNYSEDNQCTWLIDSGESNRTVVQIYLDHFATECSWDHLYIYDGGSIYDPILAVYSGVIVQDHNPNNSSVPIITSSSGKALVHFYSDAAYNLTGFSIGYKIGGCPSASHKVVCSGHGVCLDNICTCDGGWSGDACSTPICPSNCSDHGHCQMENHRCICDAGFTGNDCSQKLNLGWWDVHFAEISPSSDNSLPESELERASHAVAVIDDVAWIAGGHSFVSKSFLVTLNLTEFTVSSVQTRSKLKPSSRLGHSLVVYNGSLYMYGGTLKDGLQTSELWKFSISELLWQRVESFTPQPHKSDHKNKENKSISSKSLNRNQRSNNYFNILHRFIRSDKALVELESEVDDEYNVTQLNGNNFAGPPPNFKRCSQDVPGPCPPVASVGHAAVVIKESIMLILFGYSSSFGTLNLVQEYHFDLNQWKIVKTQGALTAGAYGMSAIWDPGTSLVYCHGGLRLLSSSSVGADLLTYDPFQHKWTLKTPAPFPRYLHTAFHMPGLMLIFGGNTHNDTSFSNGAKCYSADFLAYDIYCNKWHWMKNPSIGTQIARYGHATINHKDSMLILGGFNGRMLSSALLYQPGSCNEFNARATCLDSYPGRKCIWNRALDRCENFIHENKIGSYDYCGLTSLDEKVNYASFCGQLTTCNSCLTHSNYGCLWCTHTCMHEKCTNSAKGIDALNGCEDPQKEFCKTIKSCYYCQQYHPTCLWLNKECTFASSNITVFQHSYFSPNKSSSPPSPNKPPQVLEKEASQEEGGISSQQRPSQWSICRPLCSQRKSCDNCTQGPCMWCFNEQRCVSNNSYLISFPYGQCREWTTETGRCYHIEKGQNKCRIHQTCKACHVDVGCGWCDDGSGTGTGVCLPGGDKGPINPKTKDLQTRSCPKDKWFFTNCPPCSCNGHSYCHANSSICIQPCGNNTTGLHCNYCKDSFYGNPINGGLCKPCQCNNHGDTCEGTTGKCHCYTKGVIGDHCDSCDTQNNYYGHPRKGSCFYDLQIDYQFTFNLSKQEDMHIRQINFYNVPSKPDVDTDFDIQCSKSTQIKISARQTGNHESWIVKNYTGKTIKQRFSASDYVFGSPENNTTFHVYVFDFVPPIEIIISFSQHPKLDLIQFFSIFTLCFMFLLLLAFILWKIKQKYDLYTRRQRLMVEIHAMASRPFQSIFLELQLNEDQTEESTELVKSSSDIICSAGSDGASAIAEDVKCTNGPVIPQTKRHPKANQPKAIKKAECSAKDSKDMINVTESLSKLNGGGSLKRKCNGVIPGPTQMCIHRPDSFIYKNKNNPSPIALEPCGGDKAAVLSLLVQLPTGGCKYTPSGHPGGLAAASTLVSLGTPCHSSVDISSPPKEASKGKNATKVKIISPNNYDTSI